MPKQYVPNAVLKVENSQVYAVLIASQLPPELIPATSWLTVLEIQQEAGGKAFSCLGFQFQSVPHLSEIRCIYSSTRY